MNKRKAANDTVRNKIIDALLALMETKNFSEISITEIVTQAGVARQSYYRNFSSREAILEAFFDQLRAEVLETISAHQVKYFGEESLTLLLATLRTRRRALLTLQRAGFSEYNLAMINQYEELIFGDMPARSIERYRVYIFAGAIYNTTMVWLANGAVESCEDVARILCNFKTADLIAQKSAMLP